MDARHSSGLDTPPQVPFGVTGHPCVEQDLQIEIETAAEELINRDHVETLASVMSNGRCGSDKKQETSLPLHMTQFSDPLRCPLTRCTLYALLVLVDEWTQYNVSILQVKSSQGL